MVPLSVTLPPVTVVPSSVSVWPLSTVSWVLPSVALRCCRAGEMIVPLLVTVPPVMVAPFSVSVAVPSTVMVPPPLATVVPWSIGQRAAGQNLERVVGGDGLVVQRIAGAADIDLAGIAQRAVLQHRRRR